MGIVGSSVWAKLMLTSPSAHGLAPWRLKYACADVDLATKLPGESVLEPTVGIHQTISSEGAFDLGCPNTGYRIIFLKGGAFSSSKWGRGLDAFVGVLHPSYDVDASNLLQDTITRTAHSGSDGTVANARCPIGDIAPTLILWYVLW
jgi:hypothetical protein